jgi:hypothetical protein
MSIIPSDDRYLYKLRPELVRCSSSASTPLYTVLLTTFLDYSDDAFSWDCNMLAPASTNW